MVFKMHILKLASYPFKGLYFIIYTILDFIYSISEHIYIGTQYLLYVNFVVFSFAFKGSLFICYFVYSILKHTFKGIAFLLSPILSIFHTKPKVKKPKTKKEKIEEVKPEKVKEIKTDVKKKTKEKKQKESINVDDLLLNFVSNKNIFIKQKQEELRKKREALEKSNKRKKDDSEAYINENVKIEKPTLLSQIKTFFGGFGGIFASISNKFKNNTFSKNRRNRREMSRKTLLIDFEGADAVKSEKKVLYQYVAKAPNGKVIKDYFNAYSKVEVHSYLLSEGYEVYSIKTNKWIQIMHAGTNTNKTKFKNKDLIFFLTQLSTYIKAGIPLVEALRIISRQYKKKTYVKIFRSVIYELTIGENLSSAMEKQNVAFPKLLINMVKTAEMTGSLPEVLDDMAEYYTEAEATRKQMITAMTYPSIVFTFSMGVMLFVMLYVVPKFVEIYKTMETELPLITKVILGISSFLRNYWYLVLVATIFIIVGLVMLYKKNRSFRTIVQYGAMHLPIFKNVIIYNEVTMFTKTFSSLLAHNVPITDSMEILNKITNNEIYKMLILDTIANLARGGKISDAFKDHWAFPIPAYEMIVTGEATGELSEMMAKVSAYYQELHKNSVTRIKTFVEPALTVFLTVGVGIILLSIVVPMFDMYSAVQEME